MSTKPSTTPLAAAATAIEEELQRYERVTAELRRPVNSEKSLKRTKHLIEESSHCEQRMAERLHALVAAINGVRARQEACLEVTNGAVEQLQKRAGELEGLLLRFSTLGQAAKEINEPVKDIVSQKGDGADAGTLLHSVTAISQRMESLVGEADQVLAAAEAGDWPDLAREAKAMKQQMRDVRHKILLVARELASNAPS